MSYTRTLLSEIKREGGDEFLASLRRANIPDERTLFEPLDNVVFDIKNRGLEAGEFIELRGPAGSGKTTLLYYLAIRSILPREWQFSILYQSVNVQIGGTANSVIVFDNDGRWNISRVRILLRHYIEEKIRDRVLNELKRDIPRELGIETDIADLVDESLSRLYICKPHSSLSFLTSIETLSETLCSMYSFIPRVKYVYIDSITAFIWQDKLACSSSVEDLQTQMYKKIICELDQFARKWNSIVIATSWDFSKTEAYISPQHPTSAEVKNYSPSPWIKATSLRFLLCRNLVMQFSPGVDLQEAQKQNKARLEIILFTGVAETETIGNQKHSSGKMFEFQIAK